MTTLSDDMLLDAIGDASDKMRTDEDDEADPSNIPWAMRWDIERLLPAFTPAEVMAALISAKERKLIRGCCCGCSGDFVIIW